MAIHPNPQSMLQESLVEMYLAALKHVDYYNLSISDNDITTIYTKYRNLF